MTRKRKEIHKIFTQITIVCNTTELVSKELYHLAVGLHGSHFEKLCREFDFYQIKKNIIIFQNERGNGFTLLIFFIVKSLQKEQNSTNLLLAPNLPE